MGLIKTLAGIASDTRRIGKQTVRFLNPPVISAKSAIVGEKESKGPLSDYFLNVLPNDRWGEKTFELVEKKMMEFVVRDALIQAKLLHPDILICGDLLNQITSSSYTARTIDAMYLGLYGACSTMVESIMLGACLIDAGFVETAACATSSHFASAERQFRTPLEHGYQRTPYAQWTVTGAGCTVLGCKGNGVRVTHATIGKVTDFGIIDITNMGAAMAPAALETISRHFQDTGTGPEDYDLIMTGDLGKFGSDVLRLTAAEHNIMLERNYKDCGTLIYALDQSPYQGGSGAGCSAVVLNSFVLEKMRTGEFKKVLFVATGALMSAISTQQGETIPAIAHAIVLES